MFTIPIKRKKKTDTEKLAAKLQNSINVGLVKK